MAYSEEEARRLPGESVEEWHNRLQTLNSGNQEARKAIQVTGYLVNGKAGDILHSLIPGEPVFILRGKDILALMAIQHYTSLLEMYTPYNTEQLDGMAGVADSFRLWQRTHPHQVKLPD